MTILANVKEIRELRESFGAEIILFDEQDESTVYRILTEFQYGELPYAVLQSKEMAKEGEVAIFRITRAEDGSLELENIEDDEEWEAVSEIYDEMTLPQGMDQ